MFDPQRFRIAALFLALAFGAPTILAAQHQGAINEIFVTSDSESGWTPSPAQQRAAEQTVTAFLAALDNGRANEAHALLTEANWPDQPLAKYAERLTLFNVVAGAVKARRIVRVTWSKNPSAAPAPGVYAAVDLVSRFAEIDRHCGFLVLYSPKGDDAFRVVRQEDNYVTNAQYRDGGGEKMDRVWEGLSANCPNHPGSEKPPLAEAPASTIGYATVAEALKDLRARPGVGMTVQNGWTIANDSAGPTLWSFAPVGHPAYPAVVRRKFVKMGDGLSLDMDVHCEADKAPCDDLVRSFQQLNAQMIKDLKKSR